MRKIWGRSLVFCLTLGLTAASMRADDAQNSDAKALARIVAPFVNEATQMVGHVDVKKLDIKKYFQTVFTFVGENNQEVNAMREQALMIQEKLLKAGVRDVLCVVNVSNPMEGALPEVVVVAPLETNSDVDELLKLIAKVSGFTAKVENNNLVARFGPMKEAPAKNRPEFSEGLEALKDKNVRFIVAPTAEVRQVAEQQKVNLPLPLRGVEITLLTKGIRWFGVGHDAMFTQHHVLQATDAQVAKDLKSQVDKVLAAQEKLPRVPVIKDLKQQGVRLTWAVNDKGLTGMLMLQAFGQVAAHTPSTDNLKHIGRALWKHHDALGLFPAHANFDQNGQPLLSWRVHILPYIEQQELYKQFKLDQPWDSPNNKKLIERMPRIYASPLSSVGQDGKTTYLAVTGKGAIFDGTKGVHARTDVIDGTSNTIMVLEANDTKAVTWTRPEDFAIDTIDPLAGLVLKNIKGIFALFADGSVRSLSPTVQPATLRALFTRNGGEVVNPKDY